jgi:hypothetical protein
MYVALCHATVDTAHAATMFQRHLAVVKELRRRQQHVFAQTAGLEARALVERSKIIQLDTPAGIISLDMIE